MFHKILAALDASERAPSVFDVAVQVARLSGARLYVLRAVLVPPEFPPAAAGSPADPLVARMATDAMQDLSRLVAATPENVALQPPMVRLGTPWRMILETAEECDVDLIVIGSHGYHGWDRVLGTTAGRVANSSTRSVLVVHERKPRSAARTKDSAP
jgi:nucleotide-binding universal stress UspA family protein